MSQTTWTKFGPDMPVTSLPPQFSQCLPPNQPTQACDAIVGSASAGNGTCADPMFMRTTYCACVNNATACPEFSMAACANSARSYKPWAWYQPTAGGASKHELCAKSPICVNLLEIGGSQNVVNNITQQCGIITNITNVLKTSPALAVLTFLLLISLIVVMSMQTDDRRDKNQPPPPGSYDNFDAPPVVN